MGEANIMPKSLSCQELIENNELSLTYMYFFQQVDRAH